MAFDIPPADDRSATFGAHVALLGLLYLIAGIVAGLAALALLILGVGAVGIARSAAPGVEPRATATAVALFALGVLLAAWAVVNAGAGLGLRRRRPWARYVSLGVAVVNLFVLPFGTALSVYALWVLLHNDARALLVQR